MIVGSARSCTISTSEALLSARAFEAELKERGFEKIAEGAFGSILQKEDCVVKLIKDVKRCDELETERAVYFRIEETRTNERERGDEEGFSSFFRFPRFNLFRRLSSFCHFNMEKVYPTLSTWEDAFGVEMEISGETKFLACGVVREEMQDSFLMFEINEQKLIKVPKKLVSVVDRPGALHHFYVNHIDPNLNEKLPNGQGVLLGSKTLVKLYGEANVRVFAFGLGLAVSHLIFRVHILPVDIEVVIAAKSREDRTPVLFVLDFNEAFPFSVFPEPALVAKAMKKKNGKNYFPFPFSPLFECFAEGFLKERLTSECEVARAILELL